VIQARDFALNFVMNDSVYVMFGALKSGF